MTTPKKIKPLDGFSNVSDADVVSRCTNIQTSMTGNPHFPWQRPAPPTPVLADQLSYIQTRLNPRGDIRRRPFRPFYRTCLP